MNRVILYGHKYGSHSHSAIHHGFYRAFMYMDFDAYWVDDNDDITDLVESGTIFLTEGNVCSKMPRRKDCCYILHNCPPMEGIGKYVNIQYLTKEYKDAEEISHGIKLIGGDCVMFSWGASLLPHEFDESLITKPRERKIYYLGTVDHPNIEGGNYKPVTEFAKEVVKNGYEFLYRGGYSVDFKKSYLHYISGWISEEDQIKYLTTGFAMPALQGERQLTNGMIPCRLFKAIQYGMDGITNNEFAHEFFNHQTLFDTNPSKLFYEAEKRKDEIERKRYLFNFVKEKHTYLNNVQAILKVLL